MAPELREEMSLQGYKGTNCILSHMPNIRFILAIAWITVCIDLSHVFVFSHIKSGLSLHLTDSSL